MKALTLTQPSAYLSGVLHGDGWLTPLTLGLRTKDSDFARAFADAVREVFSLNRDPRLDERRYWLYRTSNKTGRFNTLRDFEAICNEERRAWLRGLFDSEGNAQLRLNGISQNSYGRRVAFYSTTISTLTRARSYLERLGLAVRLNPTKASTSHRGTKTVYELALAGSRENYRRFSLVVGSSIQRKSAVLNSIPDSYKPDLSAHCRIAQAAGAVVRQARRDAGGRY